MDIRFDFNAICRLESIGFGVVDLPEKGQGMPMSTIRALLYAGAGMDSAEAAGEYLGDAVQAGTFESTRDAVMTAWERDLPNLIGANGQKKTKPVRSPRKK